MKLTTKALRALRIIQNSKLKIQHFFVFLSDLSALVVKKSQQ
jgi:hypothetical protein